MGSQCTAEYKLLAKDGANNASDFSNPVAIAFSNLYFKRAEGNPGDLINNKPTSYALHAAYPNPFNPSTQINFDLPEDGFVTLNVFDVLGRKVGELANGLHAAGYHTATWNASKIASGVYFARFSVTDEFGKLKFSRITKLMVAK